MIKRILINFFIFIYYPLCSYSSDNILSLPYSMRSTNYFLFIDELCDMINLEGKDCKPVRVDNILESISLLNTKQIDFSYVQSDYLILFNRFHPNTPIVSVAKIYDDTLTIIVRNDNNISDFYDLEDRIISTNGIKGHSRMLIEKLAKLAWNDVKFKYNDDVIGYEISDSLCDGIIDAAVLLVSHPNILVHDVANECSIKFIEVPNDLIKKYNNLQNDGYYKFVIADNIYKGVLNPTLTLATNRLIATRFDTKDEKVELFLRNMQKVLDNPKNSHLRQKIDNDFQISENVMKHKAAVKFFSNYKNKNNQ